jgi:isocitrate lyase
VLIKFNTWKYLEGKMDPKNSIDYHMPIIADGEAGFGGPLNVYELTKRFIKAGSCRSSL